METLCKNYINILAKLVCLLVSVYCIANNFLLEKDDNTSHRSLKSFDYHSLEKHLCQDNKPDRCNACVHKKDSIKKHPRQPGHERNLELIKQEIERQKTNSTTPTKIVFLGDSITEQWNGRMSGKFKVGWAHFKNLFDEKFSDGTLALGIAGDTFSWLHWRIRHGEVPDKLNPKIWWVHIGTNDIKFHCEASRIVLGIMHIVEEIRSRKPDAIIVVNAILPNNDYHSGGMDTRKRINDALRRSVKGMDDDNIHFFDAFNAFFDRSTHSIQRGLHFGPVHLTVHGYDRWGSAIIKWTKQKLDIDLSK